MKKMMNKNMKAMTLALLLLSAFCSLAAQERTEHGRDIAFGDLQSASANVKVDQTQLSHRTGLDVSNALFGQLAGLQVLQNAGNAWNNSASLFVRGLGTLTGKTPLVLVDGFERSLSELTVEEIASVSVLKDPVALSLYGGRGANGVVLVTTKRGFEGKPVIDFSIQFNRATPVGVPQFVDGPTYAMALNESLVNDGLSPRYSEKELQLFRDHSMPDLYPDVDWMNESLRDHSCGSNTTFSIRGGGKVSRYFAELNCQNDLGILGPVRDNDGYSTQFKYTRFNIRTNLDVNLTKHTKLRLNMLGNFSEHNRPGTIVGDIFKALYQVPAGAFPVRTANKVWGGSSVYANNPVAQIAGSGYARSQGRTLYADMTLTRDLSSWTPGLSVSLSLGLDNRASYWDSNERTFGYESAVAGADGKPVYRKLREEGELRFGTKLGNAYRHSHQNVRSDYDRIFRDAHQVHATLLYALDQESGKGQNKTYSYMDGVAMLHYGYKNRYLAETSLSASATSVLEPGHRWGFFPSVGLAWVLSEEDFLKASWLNLLKLRVSFGEAGKADYAYDLYKSKYGAGSNYYFKTPPASFGGTKEKQLPVKGLTYERSRNLNAGLDLRICRSLSLTVDGFYNRRSDILVDNGRMSGTLGIAAPKTNAGVVDNRGIEVAARWNGTRGDFAYDFGGNFSFTRSRIVEMNERFLPHDYLKRTGKSLNQIFGYEVTGIYRSQREIDESPVRQMLSKVAPGDYIYKDQNGDNVIDEYDKIPLGYNSLCPEIYYGFDLGLSWRGLGIYALFQGAANYSQVLNTRSVFRPMIGNNTISQHYYDNRWTPSRPEGIYPRLTSNGSPNNYADNSVWISDASFLKLRTLEIQYRFSEKLFSGVPWIREAKVFARGYDLFSFDAIPVFDPESIGEAHPLMRQFNIGCSISFQ